MKNKNAFLLLALASCWGPSFLFIKIAIAEVSPMMVAGLRIGIAALILFAIVLLKGERLPLQLGFWKKVTVAGFFAHAFPFVLINWGEQYVDSALASILNGLTPLSTIILAQLMLKDEKVNRKKIQGVLLGLLGLIILVLPGLLAGIAGTTMGICAVALAALSYGVGLVYIRRHLMGVPLLHAPAGQLIGAAAVILPLAFLVEPDFSVLEISWHAVGSIVVLGTFGTALAFIIYFKLLERTSAAYVSLVTYLMPVFGIVLGMIFLNESLTVAMIIGTSCIMGGISLVNNLPPKKRKPFEAYLDPAYYSKFR